MNISFPAKAQKKKGLEKQEKPAPPVNSLASLIMLNSEEFNSKNTKPLNRRQRRKNKHNLREFFANRQNDKKWLETHIWHAKRFHMANLWGYRVPLHPNDKGRRAIYRDSLHRSVMIDLSYFECFTLSLQNAEKLNSFFDLNCPSPLSEESRSRKHLQRTFLNESYPTSMICPLMFQWINDDLLSLWVHPSSHDALCEIFVANQIDYNLNDKLSLFEFHGPLTLPILKQTIRSHDAAIQSEWTQLRQSPETIHLEVEDPRLKYPIHFQEAEDDNENMLVDEGDFKTEDSGKLFDQDYLKALENGKLKECEINARKSKLEIPGSKLENDPAIDPSIPIMLSYNPMLDNNNSTLLVLPKCYSTEFLRLFHFAGVRIAGLRERHFLFYEAEKPFFPDDYLTTDSGEKWWDTIITETEMEYNKKPPAKRPNFKKLNTLAPFGPDWDVIGLSEPWILQGAFIPELFNQVVNTDTSSCQSVAEQFLKGSFNFSSSIVAVSVSFDYGGSAVDYMQIFSLNEQDIELFELCTSTKPAELPNFEGDDDKILEDFDKEQMKKDATLPVPCNDQMIGFTTTGSYSFSKGKSFAIGYVSSLKFVEYCRRIDFEEPIVMIKHPNWSFGRFAKLSLCSL
ncbi:POP1-domain-containing protein [Rozella allomycis CSF55]|uniref:POP1-domain-containing protein n=1 Tax=Rozella allomycis (strain CSF55) TaxID=988480 RepID=A0A4P9YLC7_ROZAC|nr:POP1-domain-containing protein [Rozella allomycis CSF55]